MRIRLAAGFLFCGSTLLQCAYAQAVDPNLVREVAAVRAQVARSMAALRQYSWTEHTEVLVKGKAESAKAMICRYAPSGDLTKTPVEPEGPKGPGAVSKRPMVRKKADMQDYIERAVTRIHSYLPPNPEQIDYLVQNGKASLGQFRAGKSEVRFTYYFQEGDSMVFTYDSASKALLHVSVESTMGSPKDPVSMEADFENLPDGVTHFRSATLKASAKKVQVNVKNVAYQKVAN